MIAADVARAQAVAARTIRRPSPFAVVVEFDAASGVVALVCGFQSERRTWLGRRVLDVCQVRVTSHDGRATVASSGTYSAAHYRMMAAIKDSPMSEVALDLQAVRLEPADAWARIRRLARLEPGVSAEEPRHLALTMQDGLPVWQATCEVPKEGLHTIWLDAVTGRVVRQAFDPYSQG